VFLTIPLSIRQASARVWDDPLVITEHALLEIKPGREPDFEAAFAEAKTIIASMPGFESLEVHRCIERPSCYLLLVEWASLEDHTEGFRKSAEYQDWRRLLHHFYEPFPTVEHYSLVTRA
jgi:heme-degrading monooxygenase HmoA